MSSFTATGVIEVNKLRILEVATEVGHVTYVDLYLYIYWTEFVINVKGILL